MTSKLAKQYEKLLSREKMKIARILKQTRLKLGLTLEQTCEGICSTSYLSKIENCVVDIDETYFRLICNKLNIDFDTLMSIACSSVFEDVLVEVFNDDLELIKNRVNNVILDNYLGDIEIELVVILYNLVLGNLNEASLGLKNIEKVLNTLLQEEKEFYNYVLGYYYFLNGDYNSFRKLFSNYSFDSFSGKAIKVAFVDLILDYYFFSGDRSSYTKYYIDNLQSETFRFSPKLELKHYLQELIFTKNLFGENVEEKLNATKLTYNTKYQYVFDYYYNLYYFQKGDFQKVIDDLYGKELKQDSFLLLCAAYDKMQNLASQQKILKLMRGYKFIKYGSYYNYLEFLRLKVEQYTYNHLYNYLKDSLFESSKPEQNEFIQTEELKQFLKLGFEMGKYKETVKHIANFMQ